jgi:alanyl-tRNA synthetase
MDPKITSLFNGYDSITEDSKIVAMAALYPTDSSEENAVAEALSDGQTGAIITAETPFYGTMGGQVGDTGVIENENGTFEVTDTLHVAGSKIAHVGRVTRGMFKLGDTVTLKVDEKTRLATCRNHSATHLLQKALREVLGTHVEQSGSYQDAGRTRFDFSHFKAMTPEEIKKVEDIVNEEIADALPVETDIMGIDDAKKSGAMALFGEKYGDKVRVVRMGDFSKELCGGTHVSNTSVIGQFKILSESGVAAGVRRIEAITGDNVKKYYEDVEKKLEDASEILKATPDTVSEHIKKLQEELKAEKSENEALKSRQASESLGDAMDKVTDIGGISFLAASVDNVDMNGLRELGDKLRTKLEAVAAKKSADGAASNGVVIMLMSAADGKVSLMAMADDNAISHGAHAGNLVKGIAGLVGGGGGGRPNMAQAGGKNPAGIPDALKAAPDCLAGMVK